jgi:uncharacterized protein (DUF2249 family)
MFILDNDLPPPARVQHERYPLGEMQVGQSFFVPVEIARKARAAVRMYMRRHVDKKYSWKYVEGGIRIWRVS